MRELMATIVGGLAMVLLGAGGIRRGPPGAWNWEPGWAFVVVGAVCVVLGVWILL
jgi:hypothetical protein